MQQPQPQEDGNRGTENGSQPGNPGERFVATFESFRFPDEAEGGGSDTASNNQDNQPPADEEE